MSGSVGLAMGPVLKLGELVDEARVIECRYMIPIELTVGQAIVECGLGKPCFRKNCLGLVDRATGGYAEFKQPEDSFEAYGARLTTDPTYVSRMRRYWQTKNLRMLMLDLSGRDGKPAYFQAPDYIQLFFRIINQRNVSEAMDR